MGLLGVRIFNKILLRYLNPYTTLKFQIFIEISGNGLLTILLVKKLKRKHSEIGCYRRRCASLPGVPAYFSLLLSVYSL